MIASLPWIRKMNSNSCLSTPPARAVSGPPWLGLSVLLLAGFVTIFDLFVVNVAIPSMQADLGANFAQIGFIVAGYELAFGVLLITGGRLGDLFGRRRLFVTGMAGFTLASALCGLAPSAEFLIGARVLQGLAAALLFPQVYASIRVNFDGDDSRRAFGLLGMTLGLAAIAGQVLGGWLVHADLFGLGWRSIFLINVPIGLFAIAAARTIPESCAPQRPALDWMGVALVSAGLTLLLVPLIEGPGQGWPAWSLLSLGVAVLLLALFHRQQEQRRMAGGLPLVDMRLLAQRRFALGAVLVLLVYSTSSSFFLCFALLVQTGLGLDPFMAGSIFAPCSVGFVLASLAAPRLVARWGTRAIVAGAMVYAVSIGLLIAQVWMAGAELVPARLIPVLVVVGAGQGFIMTPLLNLVLGFVDEAQAGMASGVISTVQQVGAALGVAVVGILFAAALAADESVAAQAGVYASAFVAGMLYNLGAALLVCVLLLMLARTQRLAG
ncbi:MULTISPECIES: MFS transporter [Pseudomonas]|jgi:EmrB/QacA subfamily drug resistance transporter|uniref:Drug efflux pump JefA n=6 Tax=Pseudomonadota TaxID=1224 RepID=A0ABM8LNY2_9BURK|nr:MULTISPECIES: MFS transporter [Pseudomonas]UCM26599.1 MFS transporter [Pseudomonas sp. PS1(2021)]CAB3939446.1 Drug efflux pump JefA [Achromobacter ruhlandii]CDM42091.1 major facilitator superfamily MFS_1 [Pseudomonas oleovorans CECT 5344]CDR92716.1 major facilitator superfamily MFS_1 [Pseudomonas oleovorans]